MIYLDNNATTKVDERVLSEMLPYFSERYGNAASNHLYGVEMNKGVKNARKQVAKLLGCEVHEITFTSGATEAINTAIKGVAKEYSNKGKHIVTLCTEHPAILDTCKSLEDEGFQVTYLKVNNEGLINLADLKESLRPDTILVSVMYVNNETGVLQPLKEISKMTHDAGAFFMTDATQAAGKIPINVDDLGVDILALSGHKYYGPKGIGVLYCRSMGGNKIKIPALIHGGGHERGLRSGTLNVPAIVGLGYASIIALNEMTENEKKVRALRDYLESSLLKIKNTYINGSKTQRIYNTTNILFVNTDADAIISGLQNIMVSNGSACTSAKTEPSHVLTAIGLGAKDAYSSIRFSLGKFNTKREIESCISEITNVVHDLRLMHT